MSSGTIVTQTRKQLPVAAALKTGKAIMDWRRLGVAAGCATAFLAVLGAAGPVIRSDPSPWASVVRVESVRSEILAMHVTLTRASYCAAERAHNVLAMEAVMSDVENLEQQYAKLNQGRELPIRPCP